MAVEKIAESPGEAKKKARCESIAKRLKILSFLGMLLVMIDFYEVWGNLSLKLQTVNLLPHHRISYIQSTIATFRKMATIMDESDDVVSPQNLIEWPSLKFLPVHIGIETIFAFELTPGQGTGNNDMLHFVCKRAVALCHKAEEAIRIRFPELNENDHWCSLYIPLMADVYRGEAKSNEKFPYESKLVEVDPLCIDEAKTLLQTLSMNKRSTFPIGIEGEMMVLKLIFTVEDYYDKRTGLMKHLARYCMSVSVESVVESIGSILRMRSEAHAQVGLDVLKQEVKIGWQGPQLANCDAIVKKSLNVYFNGRNRWHFTAKDSRAKFTVSSKVVERIGKKKCFVNFYNFE